MRLQKIDRGVEQHSFFIDTNQVEEAVFMLKTYGEKAAVMAGGTGLLRELKRRVQPTQPQVLVNIKSIVQPKLGYITEDTAGLRIGSITTLHNIETDELIRRKYNLLAEAAHVSGSPQYRNMATLGGDLCQHVRCWYYQASGNAFLCRRKGGDKCYAVDGDNRYHAIFRNGDCYAVCSSDVAPALIALGAKVKITGIPGERTIPLEDFFTPLGNVLQPTDILTEIQIPTPEYNSRGSFIKVGVRNQFDLTVASVAVLITIADDLCSNANAVLGGVSPAPWRAVKAEDRLVGASISKKLAENVAQAAIEGATPLHMNAYKLDIVKALIKHAILELA